MVRKEGNRRHGTRAVPRMALVFAISVAMVAMLLCLFCYLQVRSKRMASYQTSEMLAGQVKQLIAANDSSTKVLEESLKEDYISRARAVAYILDRSPDSASDVKELEHIASLISVDEIHLFDDTGTIVFGSVPKYYGYSFDSGNQMAYFKPMLEDKTLAMCQDVTPNTAESKSMMYAICWNDAGTRMVQVGIEPIRLISELHARGISEMVSDLPSYDGRAIYVATLQGEILGDSEQETDEADLAGLGIDISRLASSEVTTFEVEVAGVPSYCVMQADDDLIVLVTHRRDSALSGVRGTMAVVTLYLVFSAYVLGLAVSRMTRSVLEEQRNATVDQLTGLLNRRAYDMYLDECEQALAEGRLEGFVYASLDLNGLKEVNDTQGHEMGDRLIRGCADCVRASFEPKGQVFRIGGDEFVALFQVQDDDELHRLENGFFTSLRELTAQTGLTHSVSAGIALARDYPGVPVRELARISDKRMYEAKRRYYERAGHDRRTRAR